MGMRRFAGLFQRKRRVKSVTMQTGVSQITIHFANTPLEDYQGDIKELARRLKDMRPVLSEFGDYMLYSHIPRQFERGGFPRRWAALSPIYEEYKRRRYGPNLPILIASGAMRAGFEKKVGPRMLRISNKMPYWKFHQDGKGRKMRKMIQITGRDVEKLERMVKAYLGLDERGA